MGGCKLEGKRNRSHRRCLSTHASDLFGTPQVPHAGMDAPRVIRSAHRRPHSFFLMWRSPDSLSSFPSTPPRKQHGCARGTSPRAHRQRVNARVLHRFVQGLHRPLPRQSAHGCGAVSAAAKNAQSALGVARAKVNPRCAFRGNFGK